MGESRKCKNILKSYLNYTSQSESPTRYHIWCFLGIVAAALRRKAWIDMGFFKVYPNMFIVLVGPPGARKTIAIRIATSLVSNNTNVHISADCTTREALIKAMKDAQETLAFDGQESKIGFHSSLTIVSEELSVFLGKDNHALLSFLTNLYDCVLSDTEVLTNNGWRTIDTISSDDLAMTLNLKTNRMEYKKINFIVKKDVDRIVEFKSRAISQAMTLEHHVLYKNRVSGVIKKNFKVKEAKSFIGTETAIHIPLCGYATNEDINFSDASIALLGWVIADGSVSLEGHLTIGQDSRKVDKILSLLNQVGAKYSINKSHNKGRIVIFNNKEYKANNDFYTIYVSNTSPEFFVYSQKRIQKWMKNMSPRQFSILLDSLVSGDGTHISATNKILTTVDKGLVDSLQELAVKSGWASYYSIYIRNEKPVYQMSFNRKMLTGLSGGSYNAKEARRQIKEGPAKVWCVNTDNKTMVIRRNGKVSITGNCSDKWEYRTKNMGTDLLHGTWLNMLAATTPAWLSGSIPLTAIGGGFTSRIIFIVEEGPRHKKSIPKMTPEEKVMEEEIIFDLEQISLLQGEVMLSMGASIGDHRITQGVHKGSVEDCAYCWFDNWYMNKKDKLESDPRFSGYSSRKHVHVLKVAMLLSVCEGNSLVVTKNHLVLALGLIDELEDKMVDAFGAVGRSDVALDIGDILDVVKEVKKIPKKDLLRGLYRNVSPVKFEQAIRQLIDMKYIHQYISPDGNIIYEWLGKEGE